MPDSDQSPRMPDSDQSPRMPERRIAAVAPGTAELAPVCSATRAPTSTRLGQRWPELDPEP
eukprot:568317-Rhodomonas_salina.1